MTDQKPKPWDQRRDEQRPAKDETERRFNETLRRMLSTPPKPHKEQGRTHERQHEASPQRRSRSKPNAS